jgi:hypothetical protein
MNARVRSSVTAYAMAMIVGYSGFALAGYFIPVRQGPPLPDAAASAALSHAFGEEVPAESAWHASRGTIFRGWLVRRAYVRGHLKTADGVVFSEQVLKVGWPFTTVRGFIRTVGGEVRPAGALLVRGQAGSGPVRFLPVQAVWPGLVFNSLWIAVVFLAAVAIWRRLLSVRMAAGR